MAYITSQIYHGLLLVYAANLSVIAADMAVIPYMACQSLFVGYSLIISICLCDTCFSQCHLSLTSSTSHDSGD